MYFKCIRLNIFVKIFSEYQTLLSFQKKTNSWRLESLLALSEKIFLFSF